MRKIIVATDLSGRSAAAVTRALLVAKATGAELEVLHVVDDDLPSHVADATAERTKDTLAEQLRAAGAPDTVRIEVVFGRPWRAVVDRATEQHPDLLVMGAHRDRGLLDMFFGSVLHRSVHLSPVPVLSVAAEPDGPYERGIIGTGFSSRDVAAAVLAHEIAPGAELRVVHSYHIPFRGLIYRTDSQGDISKHERNTVEGPIREQMTSFVKRLSEKGIEVETTIREGGPVLVLLDEVRTGQAQLLAIGRHAGEAPFPMAMGRTASELLSYLPCDLLVHPGDTRPPQ